MLVEGDDFNEPICDAVRAILDGHIILSRQLAAAGPLPGHRHPALGQPPHVADRHAAPKGGRARACAQALAVYRDSEDLIQLGAYVAGSNPALDASIRLRPELLDFLRQDQPHLHPRKPCPAWRTWRRGSQSGQQTLSVTEPQRA